MWTREFLGMDFLQIAHAFILYSVLGWLIESIYMSFCNKKLTNRGFTTCPICPIYGFGGVLGYMILHPLSEHKVILYIAGAIIATIFEFLVAKLMEKTLGSVWWDYNDKPFNYQGVICAESTIAWGLYAVIIVCYLHERILSTVDKIPTEIGIFACKAILVVYIVDFTYHILLALGINVRSYLKKAKESCQSFCAKW